MVNSARMTRRVRIACFERLHHQLQEFLICLLKLNVDPLKLSKAKDRNPQCRCDYCAERRIHPSEDEHQWSCKKVSP